MFDSSSGEDPIKSYYDQRQTFKPSSQLLITSNFHLRKNSYKIKDSFQRFKNLFQDLSGTYSNIFHQSSDFQIRPKSSSDVVLAINVFPDSFTEVHEVGNISFMEAIAYIL